MKHIKLNKLVLHNFKGVRDFTLDADGDNISVYGENATGKTTLADAFFWLLFDKDSDGRSAFEIKTLDKNGEAVHGLDHSVTGFLLIDGGEIELQKVYKEKWTKQRGQASKVFTGHETEYYINGIPKSKTEYTAYIAGIVDEKLFKMLTDPFYFSVKLDKKQRRKMLFDLFGDLSNDDIISANADIFADLREPLSKYTIDELKTVTASNKRKVNDRLQDIPNRIDEINRFIVDVNENAEQVAANIARIENEIAEKREELQLIRSSATMIDAESAKRKAERLADHDREAAEKRAELMAIIKAKIEKTSAAKSSLDWKKQEKRNLSTDLQMLDSEIAKNNARLDIAEKQIEATRANWFKVNAEQYDGGENCPTCGQRLPDEQIAEATAIFNKSKAERLEAITNQGKAFADIISDIKAERELQEQKREQIASKYLAIEPEINEAETAYLSAIEEEKQANAALDDFVKYEKEERKAIITALDIENKRVEGESREGVIISIINELEAQRTAQIKRNNDIKTNEVYKARIDELTEEEQSLAAEYEKLEYRDYLIGEFIKKKSEMLENRINGEFVFANIKLFDMQINGGIAETCEITYNGVPYSDLNNAMKINIGLDVISAFCRTYGVYCPIWIDNAESVTNIFRTGGQQIRLIVSEPDKVLRSERI